MAIFYDVNTHVYYKSKNGRFYPILGETAPKAEQDRIFNPDGTPRNEIKDRKPATDAHMKQQRASAINTFKKISRAQHQVQSEKVGEEELTKRFIDLIASDYDPQFKSEDSWSRLNQRRMEQEGSGDLLYPSEEDIELPPKVKQSNVVIFRDVSGSVKCQKIADDLINAALRTFHDNPDYIKAKTFYFADYIHEFDPDEFDGDFKAADEKAMQGIGGGTNGSAVLRKIRELMAKDDSLENFILITDDGMYFDSGDNTAVVVPGVFWQIYAGGISTNATDKFLGSVETKIFLINSSGETTVQSEGPNTVHKISGTRLDTSYPVRG